MDLYAIWSERNNAVRECNMAVAEKRQAMVDRDIAIFQRDAAFVERDNAKMQRNDAIARLNLKTNSMNASTGMMHNQSENGGMHDLAESGTIHDPSEGGVHNPAESGVSLSQGVMEMPVVQRPQQQQQRHNIVNYSEIAFKPVEVPFSDVFAQSTTTASKSAKSKKGKQETKAVTSSKALKPTRETRKVSSNKASRPIRETRTVSSNKASRPVRETKLVSSAKVSKPTRKISKRGTRVLNKQVPVANHPSSNNGRTNGRSGNLEKQHALKSGLSLNDLGLDYANLPVPFCSCTGNLQSCYKWGKGGWQSACCTTTLSMYPLPQMPNKRNSRKGGRKMSGGAFTKLIIRLASEGHDVTDPIDLKNHWARHGTNRYIIIRSKTKTEWVVDSGAGAHNTPHRSLFTTYTRLNPNLSVFMTASGDCIRIKGRGEVRLKTETGAELILQNVMHTPGLCYNLLSITSLCDEGYTCIFHKNKFKLRKEKITVARGERLNTMYILRTAEQESSS